ncbi:GPO family capsid scaffolding protein [Limnobaculum xujianqingii]|uniref:GPO family capsid scaffolding protein n=1 Tax=Limnobaculum xujianqingii TaxID=2738837 RepID=UPI00112EC215|nr:GPO family capsid scaffolding protein [Limnobaculum xujianqingii]
MPSSQLTTSWIRIATEGETVDGRVIEAQWLIDMAETYDPNVYTAMLWPEHERWYGSCGEVLELHSEPVDGLQRLFAKMCPSVDLIRANQNGQLLFCSIEPTETLNFRGTGKPYLEGLGVTNEPASIGTERMRFKSKKNGRIYGALEPLVISEVTEGTNVTAKQKTKEAGKKSTFLRLFNIQDDTPEPETEGDKSVEEKLTAIAEVLADLLTRVEKLETDKADTADVEKIEEAVTDIEETVTEVKEVVDSAEFKTLKANLNDIVGKFSKLDQTVTKLPDGNAPSSTVSSTFELV